MWLKCLFMLSASTTFALIRNGKLSNFLESEPNIKDKSLNMNITSNDLSYEIDTNYTVSWGEFMILLKKITNNQLTNVKKNMMKHYKLTKGEIEEIETAFTNCHEDYEQMLQFNLKQIVDNMKFNETHEFMIDFIDLSNFLLEQILEYNLERVNGKLLSLTKWYKQLMRKKILRQQSKIATNYVELKICLKLSVCKERWYYTEYLVEWLRQIMGLDSQNLNTLFLAIPHVLDKNIHTVKSNIKFKNTIKFISEADHVVQRDTIDYLDEVITNQKNIAMLVPDKLKKAATLLIELFKYIDDNYDINTDNEDQLEDISESLTNWSDSNKDLSAIQDILDAIHNNMILNMKIWPLETQRQIENVWSKITLL